MKKIGSFIAFIAITLAAVSASAQCTNLNLRTSQFDPGYVVWNNIPGALFRFEKSYDGFRTVQTTPVGGGGSETVKLPMNVKVSRDTTVNFRVTTYKEGTLGYEACTSSLNVLVQADPDFRALVRKSIVPLIGSTAGGFGSVFRTSLRIRSTVANQSGKLVFHPAGVQGSGADPSIPYSFTEAGEEITIDDVMALFGRTGLGSLDIIPNGEQRDVPIVEARLFNVTPAGTFGAYEQQAEPRHFLAQKLASVFVPAGDFRLNLGVRTLQAGPVWIDAYDKDGNRRAHRVVDLPADFLYFADAGTFTGIFLIPGDYVTVRLPISAGVPFYTITENKTNDPAIFFEQHEIGTHVDDYIIE